MSHMACLCLAARFAEVHTYLSSYRASLIRFIYMYVYVYISDPRLIYLYVCMHLTNYSTALSVGTSEAATPFDDTFWVRAYLYLYIYIHTNNYVYILIYIYM